MMVKPSSAPSLDGAFVSFAKFKSDWGGSSHGFKICAVNPYTNKGGQPPKGGSFPDGTVPPDQQACPCGTNPSGDDPAGTNNAPHGESMGENCFSNPAWPCDGDLDDEEQFWYTVDIVGDDVPPNYRHSESWCSTAANPPGYCNEYVTKEMLNASTSRSSLKQKDRLRQARVEQEKVDKEQASVDAYFNSTNVSASTQWQRNVRTRLAKAKVGFSAFCCVCQGGWLAGYDPVGDMATETQLVGQYTRTECIFAVKEQFPGANAASMDGEATESVVGDCWAETNAHYSPAGWTNDSPRQACLFGH
jgi:hypothetical protein